MKMFFSFILNQTKKHVDLSTLGVVLLGILYLFIFNWSTQSTTSSTLTQIFNMTGYFLYLSLLVSNTFSWFLLLLFLFSNGKVSVACLAFGWTKTLNVTYAKGNC